MVLYFLVGFVAFLSNGAEEEDFEGSIFSLIFVLYVLQMLERRKTKSSIHSIEVFNEMDEEGHWVAHTYSKLDWVLLRPSSRGHF